ncbi:hypothetical protein ACLB2K_037908 [Fragaria x ananassa]
MFLLASVSEQLTWHSSHHSQDGKMRHPMDSVCWSSIDKKYPTFASNPRNLRFGLATDGFNPFSNLSSTHSLWPVILVIYNLPPNVCMSSENLMLSLLIPGPKQPGNDIDVYLQPLIDDLKLLWDGVDIYDAYSKVMFNLRGILLWTINDFPAYGNLSGLTNKGEFACPVCGPETCSYWLPLALKTVYMDHRRFLPTNHVFRRKHKWFNGRKERRELLVRHNLDVMHIEKNVCESVLDTILDVKGKSKIGAASRRDLELQELMEDVPVEAREGGGGKEKQKKLKKGDPAKLLKKKSLFFELPYWEELLVRHNLDVMHIEKNVCESVLDTILDVKGKSKIGAASRRDLELQELMEDVPVEAREDMLDSSGPYTLTKPEKAKFLWRLWMQSNYILQQMGRLWRAYKSELTGSVMTVLESHRNRTETARLLGLIRPEDVPQVEWDQFVAERSTGEWKAKSEKMKAVRAKQLLPHTLSRKGYAREEYGHAEMEAKLAEQPPTEGPIPVKHDVLSQVLGLMCSSGPAVCGGRTATGESEDSSGSGKWSGGLWWSDGDGRK